MRSDQLHVKGIIFDFDGTIVDSRTAYTEAAEVAFSMFGKESTAEIAVEIPRRFELSLPLDDLIAGIDETKFRELYLKAYHHATITRAKPFANVKLTLLKLSRKSKLGLTTGRQVSRKEITAQLRKFGLGSIFQAIVTASNTLNPKPSPEAVLQCSRLLGVKPSDCTVVGDSVADVRAGKNAGAHTVAVLSGIFSLEELQRENPDLILENVKQLPDFVK